jgi:DNA polymerase-3 subunit alpha
VGAAAIESIVAHKESCKDLFAFCKSVDTRKVNKRVLEALIKAGALDGLGPTRAAIFASIATALKAAEQYTNQEASGQHDLFAGLADDGQVSYAAATNWSDEERLKGEHETLGLYLTGHPIERYINELQQFVTMYANSPQTVEDNTGHIDVTVFADAYQEYRDLLVKGQLLVIEGDVNIDDFTGNFRVQAKRVFDIVQAREEYAKYILIKTSEHEFSNDFIAKISDILKPFLGGKCKVAISYACNNAESKLLLGGAWRVKPTDELLTKLGTGSLIFS